MMQTAAPRNPVAIAAERAPSRAGVYFFLGAETELLYVGKAGDLRRRLHQHAQAKPGRGEVRADVLYQRVAEVRWEELTDEEAAATREADLIVALRPAFNASHADQGRWNYILVGPPAEESHTVRFALAESPDIPGGRAYGCFPHLGRGVSSRPAIACSDGYTALLRLLWAGSSDPVNHYPSRITRSAPDVFDTPVDPSLLASLHAFLSGTSSRLLGQLAVASQRRDSFLQPGVARDGHAAEAFFAHGPNAVRRLRLRHRRPAGPMPRALIESLLIAEVGDAIGEFRLPVPPGTDDELLGRRAHRWARS